MPANLAKGDGPFGLRLLAWAQDAAHLLSYPVRYKGEAVSPPSIIEQVRLRARLTKDELARRAGTSRPTLSAYEHNHKSPRLDTVERIVAEAGFTLTAEPIIHFRQFTTRRHRLASVPDRLPRLPVEQALATITLPLHLDWSRPNRSAALSDRGERARCYEIVLREGTPDDILSYIDGALLVDLWAELVIPADIRQQWQPLIDHATGASSAWSNAK